MTLLRPPLLLLRRPLLRRRRTYSTHPPPPPPPAKGIALLPDRALISVAGPDAPKFLQGLVTSQVPPPDGNGTYSCFLNSQGRMISDAFIYPTPTHEPRYLIELSAPTAPHLLTTLQRRKLRSKITLSPVAPSTLSVWAVWDDTTLFHPVAPPFPSSSSIHITDTRAPAFGHRLLAAPTDAASTGLPQADPTHYKLRRYLRGVPEGSVELPAEAALPQQSCLDYMGAIDYRKGCYVGQELTIRTYHTGVVRRRVLPVQFSPVPFPADEEGEGRVVYDPSMEVPGVEVGAAVRRVGRRARAPGVVLGQVGNVGLALCRLGVMTRGEDDGGEREWRSGDQFVVGEEGKEVWVRAVVPEWHKERAEALKR
ncbi:Aminomethyltransferase folate-binding domain-containing protein [Morchella conica CCBAS932]|uniref:Iron-sulfur cluster assembly factor IBA57 homolog, mitochondrial n=1 Tax=Morchella conica CCBAS932 TaxID=1392247 RepID=A0A3N4L3R1_9PEZI|nr:Aminomethyltransferase folate-binding domain-containing protein [Morchella conica CCBAS932]